MAIEVKKGSQKNIIEKIISGEYKLCDSKLTTTTDKKNNSIMRYDLTYSFVKPDIILDKEKVCGIDLGIAVPAYAAVNFNTYSRFKINDSSIIDEKIKYEKRTKQLQRNLTYGLLGNTGHGTKTKVQSITKSKDHISNINSDRNYQWANKLVNWAYKMGCGKIHLEDLSGYNKAHCKNKFLKHWTYFNFQLKIKQKAKTLGIEVEMVSPKHTSQKCSECGYIDSENRPKEKMGQSYFKCLKCGHKENADFNAAKNIAHSKPIAVNKVMAS